MEKTEKKEYLVLKLNKKVLRITGIISGIILVLGTVFIICVNLINANYKVSEKSLELYRNASKKYLEHDLKESIRLFKELVNSDPNFINARFMLGKAQYFGGDRKACIETWENALKINPNHIDTLIWLGKLYYYDKANKDKAVDLFNKVLALDSLNIQANYSLASAFLEKNDYKKALIHFNNSYENEFHLAQIHAEMAKMYVSLNLKDKAFSELNKAKIMSGSSSTLKDITEIEKLLLVSNNDKGQNKK